MLPRIALGNLAKGVLDGQRRGGGHRDLHTKGRLLVPLCSAYNVIFASLGSLSRDVGENAVAQPARSSAGARRPRRATCGP